jgi:hypothetical protein
MDYPELAFFGNQVFRRIPINEFKWEYTPIEMLSKTETSCKYCDRFFDNRDSMLCHRFRCSKRPKTLTLRKCQCCEARFLTEEERKYHFVHLCSHRREFFTSGCDHCKIEFFRDPIAGEIHRFRCPERLEFMKKHYGAEYSDKKIQALLLKEQDLEQKALERGQEAWKHEQEAQNKIVIMPAGKAFGQS